MSKVSLQLINDEKVLDAFRLFPKEINEEFEMVAIEAGGILTNYARNEANHKYKHRDHNLEKDTGNSVKKGRDSIILTFGLGFYPSQTQVSWRGERVSYGTILHEGSFDDKFITGTWEDNENKVNRMFVDGANNVIKRVF